MTQDQRTEVYERTIKMLKPALERVVSDPEFRNRLEQTPLRVLDELGIELDASTRAEMEGKRFSEFWAARRKIVEGPVEVRDLPPEDGALTERQLEAVAGGLTLSGTSLGLLQAYAPPYVPVGSPNLTLNTTQDPSKLP
jgi:hypothetical protein